MLHAEIYPVLHFRNRVLHYEPIFGLRLETYRDTSYRLLGYLAPVLAARVAEADRLPAVLMKRPL